MPPEHARTFGGGAVTTTLDPIVLVAMIIAIILIVALPRKYMIAPLLFIFFLIPINEQVFVGGVHFFVPRIMILFCLPRMIWTKMTAQTPIFAGGFNSVDRAFFWCTICEACAVGLLFSSNDALIGQGGFLLDYLGGYFLLRFLIRDEDDIYRAMKCLAFVALILGVCMVREYLTLQNIFGFIGGKEIPDIRNGRVRSQGPFSHELMAGAFGSTLLPFAYLLWKSGKAKVTAVFGLLGAVLMTWTSNSSTSLFTLGAATLAILFWPIRKSMRTVRWVIASVLIVLQIVMKAPVWFLIARVDLTGGSSSYHRAELIDQFVRHFSDWWLIGVKESGSWGWDMWDAQNQFVNVGQTGGLLALILFIVMISRCFARLGDARKVGQVDTRKDWFLWLLGAALFTHVVAFFGVNYFDQTKFEWFAVLAMISAATAPLLQPSVVPGTESEIAFGPSPLGFPSPISAMAGTSTQTAPIQLRSNVLDRAK